MSTVKCVPLAIESSIDDKINTTDASADHDLLSPAPRRENHWKRVGSEVGRVVEEPFSATFRFLRVDHLSTAAGFHVFEAKM